MRHITVMPHPPWFVVCGNYQRSLTLAICLLGGAFALYGEFLLHMHTFV